MQFSAITRKENFQAENIGCKNIIILAKSIFLCWDYPTRLVCICLLDILY